MPDPAPADVTIALDGAAGCIAGARDRTWQFLTRVQSEHGLPVTARTMDLARAIFAARIDGQAAQRAVVETKHCQAGGCSTALGWAERRRSAPLPAIAPVAIRSCY